MQIKVTIPGFGQPENPWKNDNSNYKEFNSANPPLPLITPSGKEYTGTIGEVLEGKLLIKYLNVHEDPNCEFKTCDEYHTEHWAKVNDIPIKKFYLITPKEEKPDVETKLSILQMANKLGIKGDTYLNSGKIIDGAKALGYKYGDLGFVPVINEVDNSEQAVNGVEKAAEFHSMNKCLFPISMTYNQIMDCSVEAKKAFIAGAKWQSSQPTDKVDKAKVVEVIERNARFFRNKYCKNSLLNQIKDL